MPKPVPAEKTNAKPCYNGIKMSREFKEWLDRFAARERADVTYLLEHGLAALAKARKFEPPPPR